MSYTFYYTVENLEHLPEDGTVIQVYVSYWCDSSIENDGYFLRYRERLAVDLPAPDHNFIPLDELTEETVRGWVDPLLAHEEIEQRLSDKMNQEIACRSQQNQTNKGLPWAISESQAAEINGGAE